MDSFFFSQTERERELYMLVRDYQFDVAISEIQEYDRELGLLNLTLEEFSYKKTIASILLTRIYDEKISWEVGFKQMWVVSPIDIIADFYYLYESFIYIAPNDMAKNMFRIAYKTAGEILERFL